MRFAVVALAVSAGCSSPDSGPFDVARRPDGVGSMVWPAAIAPGGDTAGRSQFVVLGDLPATMVTVGFDAEGARVQHAIDLASQFALPRRPVVAGDPAENAALVAIDYQRETSVIGYDVWREDPVAAVQYPVTGEIAVVTDIAVSATGTFPGNRDLLIAAAGTITLWDDYAPGTLFALSCELGADVLDIGVIGEGEDDPILALGTGDRVLVFPSSRLVPWCKDEAVVVAAPDGAREFGRAIASADFDGSGRPDVAIGARGAVYLYFDPDLTAPPEPTRLLAVEDGGSDRFGASLAVGDFTGDGDPDLAIADSEATVDGGAAAGAVTVFSHDRPERFLVTAPSPRRDQRFGAAIAATSWVGGGDILGVTSVDRLFTWFPPM